MNGLLMKFAKQQIISIFNYMERRYNFIYNSNHSSILTI